MVYLDSEGEVWELQQAMLFGDRSEAIAERFDRALLKIRKAGDPRVRWMRAPANWKTDRAIAELLTEVRAMEKKIR